MWVKKFDDKTLNEVLDKEWPALKGVNNFLPENKNSPLTDDTCNLEFLEI